MRTSDCFANRFVNRTTSCNTSLRSVCTSVGLLGRPKSSSALMTRSRRSISCLMTSAASWIRARLALRVLKQLNGRPNDAERVAHLMGDAGRELPHGRQAIRTDELIGERLDV